ncbi:acylphosphatase [Evansella sp. LMS18]|uniref:acylphosphatase n=1 Tax=Evansella sp. LMS18 TaxID=2924033 RepID=UPI0020D000B9|nr:acylphosphatase [Evansella sp. LMS18]UTR11806.1 acylphosphatase [Evansella sp. LMS18]
MEKSHIITLPHLTNEVITSARKTKLCAYAVAIEGWRRGLKLKWYTIDSGKFDHMITFGVNPPGRLFSLSSDERTHYFFRTRGDKVTKQAVEIGSDKEDTKVWLTKVGVPVPEGKKFTEEVTDEEILKECTSLRFPVVLKPTNGSLGNGVVTNIKDLQELKKALKYVRVELEYPEVIVERYIYGEEYRVYVIEDKVIAAYNRMPANIAGDGIHTIEELIELKNEQRRDNARLTSCLIEIDKEVLEFIEASGYTLDSIPKKGEKIFLRVKTNVSAGGDPIDVTDKLPEAIKQIAVNAIKAVPGLHHGGVDIIGDFNEPESAVVIELNPTAQIGGILFPMKGRSRDIPGAIIDYYFPETKGIKTDKSKIYFDFSTVLEPLQNRSGMEVEVNNAPLGKLYSKKYTVSGSVRRLKYHEWIKKEAFNKKLNGFVKNSINGEIEVVVSGVNKEAVNDFKQTLKNSEFAEVTKVQEAGWQSPVKVGFEINEGINTSSLRSVSSKLRKAEKELKKLEKDTRRMKKNVKNIERSRSWRITQPLRKIGEMFKNNNSVNKINKL